MEHLITRELTQPMKQANQANSQQSTGPKTERGKLNSRCNSWRHGIFGNELCPWAEELDEVAADYQRFQHRFQEAFQVRDDVERLLAADMARTQWRLERVLHAESAGLAWRRVKFQRRERPDETAEMIEARVKLAPYGHTSVPETVGKYSMLALELYYLLRSVEEDGYSEAGHRHLETLYGKPAVGDEQRLVDCYQALQPQPGRGAEEEQRLRQEFVKKVGDEMRRFGVLRKELQAELGRLSELEMDRRLLLPEKAAKIVAAAETRLRNYFHQTLKQLTAWRQAAVRDGPGEAGRPVQGGGGVERANGDRAQPSASGSEARLEQDPAAAAGADHPAPDTPCTPQAARSETEEGERPAEPPMADNAVASDAVPACPPAESDPAPGSGAPRRLRRRRSKRATPPAGPASESGAAKHPTTPERLRPGG